MELRQLRHFVAVAECGTYSAASAQLNLTQPALTRSIQTLEEQLQSSLFERQPRGVTLTDSGVSLLRHARLMLHQADAAKEDVHAITGGTAGQLSIGLAPMFSTAIIDKVLIALHESFPDLRFTVSTGLLGDLIKGLADASLDVVLSNIPTGSLTKELVHETLFETRSFVLVGAEHPLAAQGDVSMFELREAAWALVTQQQTVDVLGDLLLEDGKPSVHSTVETNSLTLIRTMLLSGQFVTVLPEHWLRQDIAAGRIVPLKVKGTPIVRPAGVLMRKIPNRQASVGLFVARVRDFARDWAVEVPA